MHFTGTQGLAAWSIGLAGLVVATLGGLHLLFTWRGRRLHPADPDLIERMRQTPIRLTRQTDLWRCWIGFNGSHGLGVLGYGAMLMGLAATDAGVFARSGLLAGWALAVPHYGSDFAVAMALTANAVFGALINDVVPRELIGRFFGIFRAVSLATGVLFNSKIIGHAENTGGTALTGGARTSIYAVKFGKDKFAGIQEYGLEVTDKGELDDGVTYRTVVDWPVGLYVAHPRSVARLYDIKAV